MTLFSPKDIMKEGGSWSLGDNTSLPAGGSEGGIHGLSRSFACAGFFLLGATSQSPQPSALTILPLEVLKGVFSLQGALCFSYRL